MSAIGRISIVLAVGATYLPAAARAQDGALPRASAARSVEPETLNGLAPGRNGRVAGAGLVADRAGIVAGAIPADSRELSVTVAVANTVISEPVGRVNAILLDREITAKFASVNHCRTDVARRKRLPPAQITVDMLTLRWTITGKGQVAALEVIGSTPVHPEVLDCVKRDANGWVFTAPVGGNVRLNRALVFPRLSPTAPHP